MSERSRRTVTQQSSSTETGSAVASPAGKSNSQAAETARTAEGTAAGLANYQAALGQWLGGELYGAVAGHLTLDAMSGYANKALLSALGGLSGALENLDPSNKDDVEKFSAAMKAEFGNAAGEWLKQNGAGFSADLADWVDAHPRMIVTAALLAAAGAYLANAKLPELSHAFKLGDFKAEIGAKIGRIRDISLEQVALELSHATAPLVAAVKVSPNGDQTKTEFSGSLGGDERKIFTSGEFVGQNLTVFNVGGLIKNEGTTTSAGYSATQNGDSKSSDVKVNIEDKDGNVTRATGATWDTNTGTLTVRNAINEVDGKNSTSFETTNSTDGSSKSSMSLTRDMGAGLSGTLLLSEAAQRLGANDSYAISKEHRASLGVKYDKGDLDAAMKLSGSSNGDREASGSIDYQNAAGWQMGSDAKVTFGNNDAIEAGAYFGFRNPDEFQTYMARYRYTDGTSQTHDLNLMVEEKFGPVYTRIQQNVAVGLTGTNWTTTAQGAYFVSDNVALIGGAQYKGGNNDQSSLAPQIGAQINGVPLVVTHDFETNTTTVGVTFRFGR